MGATEQQYSLRWHDFHTNLLATFRHLKEEEDFVDVTLACDERAFKAHKVVLSACSPYFRRLLKANPCQHPIVILKDVTQRNLEALLRFMYNGEVNICQEQLEDFLKTAQTLQVKGLADVATKDSHRNQASDGWGQNATNNADGMAGGGGLPPTSPTPPTPLKRVRLDRHSEESYPPSANACNSSPPPHPSSEREPSSLLGQALEARGSGSGAGGGVVLGDGSLSSHALAAEDSSTDDTANSEKADGSDVKVEAQEYGEDGTNAGMDGAAAYADVARHHGFPTALLGFQGIPGFLPGPSGLQNSQDANFVARRGLDLMRVRATDPRPCPKCGKIYRSAHTLRTHLEDKHTVCPGYRCVLCGTVAKSRNSLHSHMSRQHRGISTKDLPVLPMPAPFDPDLAAKLLAKAGVKVSPAELAARASPTGIRRSDLRLDLKLPSATVTATHHQMPGGLPLSNATSATTTPGGVSITLATESHPFRLPPSHHDDPEDLTVPNSRPPDTLTVTPTPPPALKSMDLTHSSTPQKSIDLSHPAAPPPPKTDSGGSTGSAILDTYLQFIAENSSGLALGFSEGGGGGGGGSGAKPKQDGVEAKMMQQEREDEMVMELETSEEETGEEEDEEDGNME